MSALSAQLSAQGSSSLPVSVPHAPAAPDRHGVEMPAGVSEPGSPQLGGAFLLGTPPKQQAPAAALPRPPRIDPGRPRHSILASGAQRPPHPHQEGSNLVFLSARPESYKASPPPLPRPRPPACLAASPAAPAPPAGWPADRHQAAFLCCARRV